MADGLHRNLLNEAFVRTPPSETRKIVRHLLRFPAGPFTVFDPTAGEGDLLAPFAEISGATLFGVELHGPRAETARAALPGATIVASPIEAVRFAGPFAQILAVNPPYFLQNGKRAEYQITRGAAEQLLPGGVAFGVYPARSAWNADMVALWCKHFERVQVYKFPDGDRETDEQAFARYTQIVVIGVKRERPLAEPDPAEYARLRGFRYRKPDRTGDSWWSGGAPPPELPPAPVADPYRVPAGQIRPRYVLMKADDSALLNALADEGAHRTPEWEAATCFAEHGAVAPSAMPLLGVAHMAADILSGLFDGEVVLDRYLMTIFTTQRWQELEVDDEQQEKGVRGIAQSVDHPILGVIDLDTGQVRYLEGSDDTFAFLQPLLPQFAPLVLAKRRPRYRLDPQPWELEQVARIGLDKQLPGADHPGLAVPQMHRVLAMWRMLNGTA